MSDTLKTRRTTPVRLPERGSHDWPTIAAILDEALYCHIAFEADGQPYAIPTTFGRDGRTLYIHGSSASRMIHRLSEGVPVCFTATLIDGVVVARSVFHNSMNYRSVMVLGTGTLVTDAAEKLHGLEVITEHSQPGRWGEARRPTAQELKASSVIRLPIEEASAKIRTGGPKDDEDDYSLPVWAGVVPLRLSAGDPVDDGRLAPGIVPPEQIRPREP